MQPWPGLSLTVRLGQLYFSKTSCTRSSPPSVNIMIILLQLARVMLDWAGGGVGSGGAGPLPGAAVGLPPGGPGALALPTSPRRYLLECLLGVNLAIHPAFPGAAPPPLGLTFCSWSKAYSKPAL